MKFEFINFFNSRVGVKVHVRIDGANHYYNINNKSIDYSDLSKNQLQQIVNGSRLETSIIKLIEEKILNFKFEYYKFLEKHLQALLDSDLRASGRFGKIKLSDICKSRLLE